MTLAKRVFIDKLFMVVLAPYILSLSEKPGSLLPYLGKLGCFLGAGIVICFPIAIAKKIVGAKKTAMAIGLVLSCCQLLNLSICAFPVVMQSFSNPWKESIVSVSFLFLGVWATYFFAREFFVLTRSSKES